MRGRGNAAAKPTKMPSAAIFDLDGTLLDTLQDLADSANEALAQAGLPQHPVDSYRTFVGDGIHVLIQRILPLNMRDDSTIALVLGYYRTAYGRRWKATSRPYPGICELLDSLKARGIPVAVLSNKPQYFTELCVTELLPGYQFRVVYGQRDHVPRKPDPAAALEIARSLDLPPEDIVFVGDTKVDIQTAVAAGMIPVGVAWGFRPVEELRFSGARHIVQTPQEILAL